MKKYNTFNISLFWGGNSNDFDISKIIFYDSVTVKNE